MSEVSGYIPDQAPTSTCIRGVHRPDMGSSCRVARERLIGWCAEVYQNLGYRHDVGIPCKSTLCQDLLEQLRKANAFACRVPGRGTRIRVRLHRSKNLIHFILQESGLGVRLFEAIWVA